MYAFILTILSFISHLFTISAFLEIVNTLVGKLALKRVDQPDDKKAFLLKSIDFGNISKLVFILIVFLLFFFTDFWELWKTVWMSIYIYISAILILGFLVPKLSMSYMPLAKAINRFYKVGPLFISAILIWRIKSPDIISLLSIDIGLILAYIYLMFSVLLGHYVIRKRVKVFADLDARHDEVYYRLQELNTIATYTADQIPGFQEVLSWANTASESAFESIKLEETQAAEAALIHARIETEHVELILRNWVELSFINEMKSSTTYIESNTIPELMNDLNISDPSNRLYDELTEQLGDYKQAMVSVPEPTVDLIQWLTPFLKFQKSLMDLKSAVRFFSSTGESISKMQENVSKNLPVEELFDTVMIDIREVCTLRYQYERILKEYNSGEYSSVGALVAAYHKIQILYVEYMQMIERLMLDFAARWQILTFAGQEVRVYVPRSTTTRKSAVGVIVFNENLGFKCSVTIDGSHLDFQNQRDFYQENNQKLSFIPFSLIGQRHGEAILTATLNIENDGKEIQSYEIRVHPTMFELAKETSVILPSLGAIFTLVWWLMGNPIKEAAFTGTGVGAILSMLIIAIRVWRAKRKL